MVVKRQFLTLAAFLSLALNGLTFTFLGTSLPTIQSFLDIPIDRATLLVVFLQAGLTIFSPVAGILADSFRRERILMYGCLLLGAGNLLFCGTSSFVFNTLICLLMGLGIGCILSGSNTLLVSLYPEQRGAILNTHHIFFGLGNFIDLGCSRCPYHLLADRSCSKLDRYARQLYRSDCCFHGSSGSVSDEPHIARATRGDSHFT